MLGDIRAEWLVVLPPPVAAFSGWRWLFGPEMLAAWAVGDLVPGAATWAAIKAGTLSPTPWQIGMHGVMAFANFHLFRHVLGMALRTGTPRTCWLAMQVAMLCGFATADPMSRMLVRTGVNEGM